MDKVKKIIFFEYYSGRKIAPNRAAHKIFEYSGRPRLEYIYFGIEAPEILKKTRLPV